MMSSSNQRPANRGFRSVSDAPCPIIANPLRYLHQNPRLSEFLRVEIHVKHENHQPIGSFKVRGGINLISQLTPEERTAGVIAASTGNHGQSVAYAAGLFGVCA